MLISYNKTIGNKNLHKSDSGQITALNISDMAFIYDKATTAITNTDKS